MSAEEVHEWAAECVEVLCLSENLAASFCDAEPELVPDQRTLLPVLGAGPVEGEAGELAAALDTIVADRFTGAR